MSDFLASVFEPRPDDQWIFDYEVAEQIARRAHGQPAYRKHYERAAKLQVAIMVAMPESALERINKRRLDADGKYPVPISEGVSQMVASKIP